MMRGQIDYAKRNLAKSVHSLKPKKQTRKKTTAKRVITIQTNGEHWLWRTSRKTDRLSSAGVCFSGLLKREDK